MDNLYIHFQLALFVADAGDGDVSDDGCHGIQMRVVGIGPAMDASLGAVISQDGLSSGCQLQIVESMDPVELTGERLYELTHSSVSDMSRTYLDADGNIKKNPDLFETHD